MKSDEQAGESDFQDAVADQKSNARPLFREPAPVQGEARKSQIEQDPILQYFTYDHLPPHLQDVSMSFSLLASTIVETLPRNPERTVALRKLLESKDCAVRAAITK